MKNTFLSFLKRRVGAKTLATKRSTNLSKTFKNCKNSPPHEFHYYSFQVAYFPSRVAHNFWESFYSTRFLLVLLANNFFDAQVLMSLVIAQVIYESRRKAPRSLLITGIETCAATFVRKVARDIPFRPADAQLRATCLGASFRCITMALWGTSNSSLNNTILIWSFKYSKSQKNICAVELYITL